MENNTNLQKMYVDLLHIFEGEKEEFIRELNGQNGQELEKQIEKIINGISERKYELPGK